MAKCLLNYGKTTTDIISLFENLHPVKVIELVDLRLEVAQLFLLPMTGFTFLCQAMSYGIKFDEFHNALPIGLRRLANILFPFFDGGMGNAKIRVLRELGHGQGEVGPLLRRCSSAVTFRFAPGGLHRGRPRIRR